MYVYSSEVDHQKLILLLINEIPHKVVLLEMVSTSASHAKEER